MKAILWALVAVLCVCGGVQAKSKHHPAASQTGKFDYYVLTLSWSPTFCETHPSNGQCSKHPGFVLHGLWPQWQAGGYPQHCSTSERLTAQARALGTTVFPTEDLMVHEWQTHGTCSGLSALEYFKAAQTSHESIKVPSALEPGTTRRVLSAQQVSRLVRDANPTVTARSLVVECARRELTEVRLCLSREDLQPRTCGNKVTGSCGTAPVKVPGAK
jgi:ribonuclease T2